ncbi:carbohydrate-binding family 9-like protein [Cohnella silvisoli]|uniref:Carbohydrate-binding family 9-like protein n=1 Tax=Cohnella silvisoli TaxID=2873699 RepID=A0ABV1KX12_9BACL|nr:carbohydrate-binding family 9-like protein [Cohnella silvisoli]MCD9024038.1 carbohydrate-binding family 9-like protein [Cohnella silvisoli]
MTNDREKMICRFVNYEDSVWEGLPAAELVDVNTGGPVQEETKVKVCWDESALYVRFECKDDYVVSKFLNHDDPLYEEDVVEVFIDEAGEGSHYIELELSPFNVLFDAKIDNDGENYIVHTDWHAEGIQTNVVSDGKLAIYDLRIPFDLFQKKPAIGTAWRINFYRIDDDRSGVRHFQAWSPTWNGDYHTPSRFGTLVFDR